MAVRRAHIGLISYMFFITFIFNFDVSSKFLSKTDKAFTELVPSDGNIRIIKTCDQIQQERYFASNTAVTFCIEKESSTSAFNNFLNHGVSANGDGFDWSYCKMFIIYRRKPSSRIKYKRTNARILYYANSITTFQLLLLAGDVAQNPGPSLNPKSTSKADKQLHNTKKLSSRQFASSVICPICSKCTRRNQKRFLCGICLDQSHATCVGVSSALLKCMKSNEPQIWTCSYCVSTELPFHGIDDLAPDNLFNQSDLEQVHDLHLEALTNNNKYLKVMHINTQSMVSTCDDLVFAIERYNFDVVCMSETWLKDNNLLLHHVSIPGYTQLFNNRTKARGGGVGMYVRETIKFKIRTDLINKFPSLEHLWIEIPGHNKHNRLLLGVVYRSESTAPYGDWLDYFESLLSDLIVSWDGMLLVTGDFNIDLWQPSNAKVKKYIDLLQSMNLDQLVTKATRTTKTSATLIDHMITNMSTQVTHCDVLTNLMISDHDAPYICLNVRTARFMPRFKFIRHEKNFDAVTFFHDFEQLPLSIVYSTDDPDTQVELLTNLICECLERHAPLKRTKISRPPAPWLKHPDVQLLQMECHNLRSRTRKDKSEKLWAQYREKRNLLKTSIRKSKSEFYQKALSSSKPRIVWQTIHRILHPNPQPLRIDPN